MLRKEAEEEDDGDEKCNCEEPKHFFSQKVTGFQKKVRTSPGNWNRRQKLILKRFSHLKMFYSWQKKSSRGEGEGAKSEIKRDSHESFTNFYLVTRTLSTNNNLSMIGLKKACFWF